MSTCVADPSSSGKAVVDPQPCVSELLAHFGSQELIDARRVLANRPEAANRRSIVIDVAYEEYCRRKDAGESIDHKAFAHRFPGVERSLLCLLDIDEYVANDPDSVLNNLWPEAGQEILGFHLVQEIGRGGFSRVFLAHERDLGDRSVVVKICGEPNEEAARLGRLMHPNIVRVYSVQTQAETGLTAICMPYLGCATLNDVARAAFKDGKPERGSLVLEAANPSSETDAAVDGGTEAHWTLHKGSYAEAIIEIAAQICDALAYAHKEGIYHCDVKPSNVLVTADGESKLFDFNLSLQKGGGAATVGGTLPYMAPEQLRYMISGRPDDVPQIDGRTDIFSLGVTLFEALTGLLPFDVDQSAKKAARRPAAERLLGRQQAAAFARESLDKLVGPKVARTIASCLAFEPEDRPESAETLAQQLRGFLSPVQRTLRWIKSHPWISLSCIGSLLVLVGFLAGLAYRTVEPRILIGRGLAAEQRGELSDAVYCYRSVLQRDPGNLEIRDRLYNVLCMQGDEFQQGDCLRDAAACFRGAYVLDVDASEARESLYRVLCKQGHEQANQNDHEAAIRCFSESLKLKKDAAHAWSAAVQLGMDAIDDSDFHRAREYLSLSIDHQKGDSPQGGRTEALLADGWACMLQAQSVGLESDAGKGLLKEGNAAFERADERETKWDSPKSPELLISRAYCELLLWRAGGGIGNRDKAVELFNEAIDNMGYKSIGVLNNSGYCQAGIPRGKALEHLEMAIEDPLRIRYQQVYHNMVRVELCIAMDRIGKMPYRQEMVENTLGALEDCQKKEPDGDQNTEKWQDWKKEEQRINALVLARVEKAKLAADEIRQSVQFLFEHLELAQQLGPASAELAVDAAKVYALALKSHAYISRYFHPEYDVWHCEERLLAAFDATVSHGESRNGLKDAMLRSTLDSLESVFAELDDAKEPPNDQQDLHGAGDPSAQMEAVAPPRVINIYPEVRQDLRDSLSPDTD